jgi:pimeloyl-ACP methyl ester carboxylesterase
VTLSEPQGETYSYVSRFIELAGVRLHYLEWASDGPPLVIVHGNSHAGGVYAPLAERLRDAFHVYAVDMRGHGLSDRPGSYKSPDLRDDLVRFLDALDLQGVLFVAHSRGGGASLLATGARPQRVAGVVAYEPTLPWNAMLRVRLHEMVRRAMLKRSVFPSRQAMHDHYKGRGGFKDYRPEYLRAYAEHCSVEREDGSVELASPPEVEAALYEAMLDDSGWEEPWTCDVPVLRIMGAQIVMSQPEDSANQFENLKRHFPNATSIVQPSSSHSGPFEQPEVFEATIRRFYASLNR